MAVRSRSPRPTNRWPLGEGLAVLSSRRKAALAVNRKRGPPRAREGSGSPLACDRVSAALQLVREEEVFSGCENTGLQPSDMDVVQFYDAFTPQVPLSFEEYGFCAEGESPAYMAEGNHPPYNTSGGGLSEAYVHGFNMLVEGVRQVRGTSTTQVENVRHSLVTSGNVVPTGALVFSKEPW